jgi:hypothetical protein
MLAASSFLHDPKQPFTVADLKVSEGHTLYHSEAMDVRSTSRLVHAQLRCQGRAYNPASLPEIVPMVWQADDPRERGTTVEATRRHVPGRVGITISYWAVLE